jgi:hypothetical protein
MQRRPRNPTRSRLNSHTDTPQGERTDAWLDDSLRKWLGTGTLALGQVEEYATLAVQTQGNPGEYGGSTSNKILVKRRAKVARPLRSFDFMQ